MENKTQSLETDARESGYLRLAKDSYWFSRRVCLRSIRKTKFLGDAVKKILKHQISSSYWFLRKPIKRVPGFLKCNCHKMYWRSRKEMQMLRQYIRRAFQRLFFSPYWFLRKQIKRFPGLLKSKRREMYWRSRKEMQILRQNRKRIFKRLFSSPYWFLRKQIKRVPSLLKSRRREIYWWCRKDVQVLQQHKKRVFRQLQQQKKQVALQISRSIPKFFYFLIPYGFWRERKLAKIAKSLRFLSMSFGDRAGFEKRVRKYDFFAKQAVELARTLKPELIHAHDLNAAVAGQKIWKELGIPFIYESHELWTERNRPNISVTHAERVWEEKTEKALMEDAAASITVCDSIAEHLAKAYNAAKPAVVRNTPPKIQATNRDLPGVREHFGISKSDFVAVYVGKLAANRGILDILRALTRLPGNVKVVTLGMFDPKFQPEFNYFVNKLKLQGRIFCHPTVPSEEVTQRIRDCDVSLTTMNRACLSYVYTLPNKLFESLQASLPIIGPDSPEIIRIVEMYRCGLTYRDGDHLDLAEKISELMSNSQMKTHFRQGAFEASRELCWEIEQGRLLSVYDQLFSVNPSVKTNPSLPQPVVHSAI